MIIMIIIMRMIMKRRRRGRRRRRRRRERKRERRRKIFINFSYNMINTILKKRRTCGRKHCCTILLN